MAANSSRLSTGLCLAALGGLALAAWPRPAAAEVPRTTAEWLEVYRQRQARFDAVEIDSHWQRLEGEKIVEEWDQKFYADDLGRLRLEERGRLQWNDQRPGVGHLVDTVFAFDGAEYRELYTRWEYSNREGRPLEALTKLRTMPPKSRQSRIEAEAGDFASIHLVDTPVKTADYWFLACIARAAKQNLEPRTAPLKRELGLWIVTFEGTEADRGYKCQAVVHSGEDNHVTCLDLLDDGWTRRYEVTYLLDGINWIPSKGRIINLPHPGQTEKGTRASLSFTVAHAEFAQRRPDLDFLPALPLGTWVGDRRTGAGYQIRQDDDSDLAANRLVTMAHRDAQTVQRARRQYFAAPNQLKITALYAAFGGLLGLMLDQVGAIIVRWPPRGRSRSLPTIARVPQCEERSTSLDRSNVSPDPKEP